MIMTLTNLKPFRFYTYLTVNLQLGEDEIKLESDPEYDFYTLTPAQLELAYKTNEYILFRRPIELTDMTIKYIVMHTNVETLDFWFDFMKRNKIDGDFTELIEYIGESFKAEDQMMWKRILYNKTPLIPLITDTMLEEPSESLFMIILISFHCLSLLVVASTDDSLLDQFCIVAQFIHLVPNLVSCDWIIKYDSEDKESVEQDLKLCVIECIKNSNFKMCNYLLSQCAEGGLKINLSNLIPTAVFDSKHDFVDTLLRYTSSNEITVSIDVDTKSSIVNCRFFHQLFIDDRIDISDNIILQFINFRSDVIFAYFFTVFPLIYRNNNCATPVFKLTKDIEADNIELEKMIL